MLLDKFFVGVYQPTPVSLLEDFRALLRSRNAALRMVHKATKQTNTRRTGQENQGHLPGLTSRFEAARTAKGVSESSRCVGTSLQFVFFGRCDAHGRDSSPHAVTARGLHLPRQAFNTDTDRGPKGKGRLMRVCGREGWHRLQVRECVVPWGVAWE